MKLDTNFANYPIEQRRKIVRGIVNRMKLAYGVDSKQALAQYFGVMYSTLKSWEFNGHMPLAYIVQCHEETGMTLDWLVHTVKLKSLNKPTHSQVAELAAIIHSDIAYSISYGFISVKNETGLNNLINTLPITLFEWVTTNSIPLYGNE